MKKWILVIAVLALMVPAAQAQSELQTLKDKVARLQRQVNAVEQKTGATTPSDGWWNRINWSGDFRFRTESIEDEDTANMAYGTRNRNRMRARIKMQAKVNEEMDVTVRLASGYDSSPTSTNETLDGQFSKKQVWLDQMYLTYSPAALEGFQVLLGKMPKPFLVVGGNQLIWDSDVMFEGGALKQTIDVSDETQLVFSGGGFWLDEYYGSANNTDKYLLAIQGYVKQAFDSVSSLTAGASYYDYVHVQNTTTPTWSAGNSTPTRLQNDFDLLEFFAQLDTMIQEMPFAVYGTYVQNLGTEAGYNQDTAWLAGVKLNKLEDPGSWQAGYEYLEMEKDAVMGFFTNADVVGGGTTGLTSGGTGSTAHRFKCQYQAMKNVVLAATYYMAEQETASMDYDFNKLQLDCIVKIK